MKLISARIALLFILCNAFLTDAQDNYLSFKPFTPYRWMIGVHWEAIDDDGNAFGNLFDVQNSWQLLPYPTSVSVDRYLKKGWSVEAKASYMLYSAAKLVNDTTGRSGHSGSLDVHAKYSFLKLMGNKWFDPYACAGLGLTFRQTFAPSLAPTVNVAFGANFWVHRNVGIRLQTMGKLGLTAPIYSGQSDYLQHTAGIVCRFTPARKKEFNKTQYKWTNKKRKYKGKSK